jgi:hypothetical protein
MSFIDQEIKRRHSNSFQLAAKNTLKDSKPVGDSNTVDKKLNIYRTLNIALPKNIS